MRAVIVPPRAGALSAVGLLVSPHRRDLVRSWPAPRDHDVGTALASLAREASGLVDPGAEATAALDCRYAGQSHTLTVASVADFHAEHERRNGFARPDVAIEIVALRAWATRPAPIAIDALPAPERGVVRGPQVVAEPDCTVWVPPGWSARPGALGAWIVQRDARARETEGSDA
jgi:N-methylhydantoinase A/oxoprolinase/acetone carboxylase beta subunit